MELEDMTTTLASCKTAFAFGMQQKIAAEAEKLKAVRARRQELIERGVRHPLDSTGPSEVRRYVELLAAKQDAVTRAETMYTNIRSQTEKMATLLVIGAVGSKILEDECRTLRVKDAWAEEDRGLQSQYRALKLELEGKDGKGGLRSEFDILTQKEKALASKLSEAKKVERELASELDALKQQHGDLSSEYSKLKEKHQGEDEKLESLEKEVEGQGGLRAKAMQWDELARTLQENGGNITEVGTYLVAMQAVMDLRKAVVEFVQRREESSDGVLGPFAQLLQDSTHGDIDGVRNIKSVLAWALRYDEDSTRLAEQWKAKAERMRQERDWWKDAMKDADKQVEMLKSFIEKE